MDPQSALKTTETSSVGLSSLRTSALPLPNIVAEYKSSTPEVKSITACNFKMGAGLYVSDVIEQKLAELHADSAKKRTELGAIALCREERGTIVVTDIIPESKIVKTLFLNNENLMGRQQEFSYFEDEICRHLTQKSKLHGEIDLKDIPDTEKQQLKDIYQKMVNGSPYVSHLPQEDQELIQRTKTGYQFSNIKSNQQFINQVQKELQQENYIEFLSKDYIREITSKEGNLNAEDFRLIAEDMALGGYQRTVSSNSIRTTSDGAETIKGFLAENKYISVHTHPHGVRHGFLESNTELWEAKELVEKIKDPRFVKHIRESISELPDILKRISEIEAQPSSGQLIDLLRIEDVEKYNKQIDLICMASADKNTDCLFKIPKDLKQFLENLENLKQLLNQGVTELKTLADMIDIYNQQPHPRLEAIVIEKITSSGNMYGTFNPSDADLNSQTRKNMNSENPILFPTSIIANAFGYIAVSENYAGSVEVINNYKGEQVSHKSFDVLRRNRYLDDDSNYKVVAGSELTAHSLYSIVSSGDNAVFAVYNKKATSHEMMVDFYRYESQREKLEESCLKLGIDIRSEIVAGRKFFVLTPPKSVPSENSVDGQKLMEKSSVIISIEPDSSWADIIDAKKDSVVSIVRSVMSLARIENSEIQGLKKHQEFNELLQHAYDFCGYGSEYLHDAIMSTFYKPGRLDNGHFGWPMAAGHIIACMSSGLRDGHSFEQIRENILAFD